MTETYTYDAFGTLTYIQSLKEDGVLAQTDTALSRFLYAGEQYDEVSGLYYLRARRYDTTVGRFTQEDTYLGDGRNLYVYVQNNPLKYVDPSGYCTKGLGVSSSNNAWLNAQNAGFCAPNDLASAGARAVADLLNKKIDEKLDELPPEAEQRVRDGVWNAFKGTGIAGGTIGLMFLFPMEAPLIAQYGFAAMGAGTITFGVADTGQGVQDIFYGSKGDTYTPSYNFVRDGVFGGNQEQYDAFEFALAATTFAGGIVSSTIGYNPYIPANVGKYANILGSAGEILDSAGDAFDYVDNLFENSGSIIPYSEYYEIYQNSIHNPNASMVMLGKYDGGGATSYINQAGNEYTYFSIDNWNQIRDTYGLTEDDMFSLFNEAFLDDAINANKKIKFSHNPIGDVGALGKEYKYLLENGYIWNEKTMIMQPGY